METRLKDLSTRGAAACEAEIERLDDHWNVVMQGGDLVKLAALNRYRGSVYARYYELTRPSPRPPKKRKPRKPRALRSTEYKLISSRPSEVIPDDYKGGYWPPKETTTAPAPVRIADDYDPLDSIYQDVELVVMTKADFDRAEATFKERPAPPLEYGDTPERSNYGVPDGVMAEAIRNDGRTRVEHLALSRAGGGTYPRRHHWRYDNL